MIKEAIIKIVDKQTFRVYNDRDVKPYFNS